ncbi:MAG: tetratricopeptide repeat protein, partial [Chloroflexi bacterium]|nr:tetratricopeptide repeat protein [Chloroflexota bacterium]
ARRDAIDYYQQAAALLENEKDPRSIQIYQGWGDVLLKLAHYQEAAEAYQKMLEAAETLEDCEAESRAWLAVGKIRDRLGEHTKALACAEKALELARGNDCDLEVAEAVLLKGQSHYRLGEVSQADLFIKESMDLCNKGEDNFTKSRCLSLMGLIQDDLGNYSAARDFKEQALEIIENIKGDWVKEWIGTLYNNLANTANLSGDDQRAVELYLKSLDIFRETKNQDMIIMCQVNMGAARVGLGAYQLAEEDFREVLALTESGWLGLSLTCHFLAEACLGQEKVDQAQEAALKALSYAMETGAQQALGAAWRSLGKVASRMKGEIGINGKSHSALACFQTSEGIFSDLAADGERAHTLKAWAEYELDAGDKKKGKKLWQEAREIFGRLEMTVEVEKMKKISS